jgi:hypothetical protein
MILTACGPNGHSTSELDGGGGGGDAYYGPVGSVHGTVWAPANAPGMVPAGHEIPISGALIWLSINPPDPIPQEVYCDQCVATTGASVYSDAKGNFTLGNVAPGNYWLMIQKGQFRLDQQVTIAEEQALELSAEQTTLPSVHDPDNGKWRPKFALAEGLWDNMENIVAKIGFGQVDSYGDFVGSSAAGNFDMYQNGYGDHGTYSIGDLYSLVSDLERMKQYHIIFVPCSDGDNARLFAEPAIRENIREYVRLGGKWYVTDWSAEWEDAVFPEFIRFAPDHDTSSAAGPFNDGDGFPGYTSEQGAAMDMGLNDWLHGQVGPLVSTFGTEEIGMIDGSRFVVEGNYDHIESLGSVEVGVDMDNLPVTETPYAWVNGDWTVGEGPVHPLTVTFEPGGCGRVLYSTYHTAGYAHSGLLPQERVLLYLIMEIGECREDPIID